VTRNVQRGGPYRHSREVDAMIARARESVAAFVNARTADEIAFGLNATSFIRSISLAIGQTLGRGRRSSSASSITRRTSRRGWRSSAPARASSGGGRDTAGRLNPADLQSAADRAHAARRLHRRVERDRNHRRCHGRGAARACSRRRVFLDAVHYAPHASIDVQVFDCDYLVCSGYKIFAPHMGFAWCRRESINRLPTFREDFIPDVTPDKLEAGTMRMKTSPAWRRRLPISKTSDVDIWPMLAYPRRASFVP
jgi:hypothetical protein